MGVASMGVTRILAKILFHCITVWSHRLATKGSTGQGLFTAWSLLSEITIQYVGYSVIASNDLSVIVMESHKIKSKTLAYHTNCIGYSDLGYSDKPGITIGRRKAKFTILCKSGSIADHAHISVSMRTCVEEPELQQVVINQSQHRTSTSPRPIYTC